jgi:hypothetical protein
MTAAPTDGVLDWMDKYTAKEENTEDACVTGRTQEADAIDRCLDTEKAKALRAKMMEDMVPSIEPESGYLTGYECTHDNEEARALVVLLLSMLSHEKLVELEEYLIPDNRYPCMEVPIHGGCQGFKCGDFTMRPGGLLDSMPEGWKLTND